MSLLDGRAIIDHWRSIPLGDAGLPNHILAPCVATDGSDQIWVIAAGRNITTPIRGYPPQHELTGRLPGYLRDKIWGSQLRCGRPTVTGLACRLRVKNPGDVCKFHRGPRP